MMRVLVLERDAAKRQRLRALLEDNAFEVFEATAAPGARQAHGNRVQTVLADALLLAEHDIIALAHPVPVILIAHAPSVGQAVECMRKGASDYLAWPCEPERLVAAVTAATSRFPNGATGTDDLSAFVGASPPVRELKERIHEAAAAAGPVFLRGEPGTGKELAARALHHASDRRYAPLIVLNCATTDEASIEPALFGYDVAPGEGGSGGLIGAAHDGTLLIKDIDLMPVAAQTRLVRLLDHGAARENNTSAGAQTTTDAAVRVVATSHQDLPQLAANGHFLDQLLDALGQTTLHVPPLRDRGDDVVQIAQAVLDRTSAKLNKPGIGFSAAALAALCNHPWPGNVRELKNTVERAAGLCDAPAIDTDLLPFDLSEGGTSAEPAPETTGSLEDFFVRFVLANQDQYTETELASQLGISRKSLWERRQRLNIPRRRTRKRGPRRPAAGLR
ncbi:MAG: sigma 54-interacting transcriptional regulator [Gammaproteobacteria bacterium]|nr:sigma 54-interacting transcriptional regulator [Gammaproteobacteria bacterium]